MPLIDGITYETAQRQPTSNILRKYTVIFLLEKLHRMQDLLLPLKKYIEGANTLFDGS